MQGMRERQKCLGVLPYVYQGWRGQTSLQKVFSAAEKIRYWVGCSADELTEHLKRTWENEYGTEWAGQPCHTDHIIPLSMAKTKDEVIRLCHYSNLRLITPEDNMRKSNNLTEEK